MTPDEAREAIHWIFWLFLFTCLLTVGGLMTDGKRKRRRPMAEYLDRDRG